MRTRVTCERDESNRSFPLSFIFSPPLSSKLPQATLSLLLPLAEVIDLLLWLRYRHRSSPLLFISAAIHLLATAQFQATVSNVLSLLLPLAEVLGLLLWL
ncbi:hypothetical protein HN51_034693 [Arachis hypogaea]